MPNPRYHFLLILPRTGLFYYIFYPHFTVVQVKTRFTKVDVYVKANSIIQPKEITKHVFTGFLVASVEWFGLRIIFELKNTQMTEVMREVMK